MLPPAERRVGRNVPFGGRRSGTNDSPTRRVGAEPLDALSGVEHAAAMLSLSATRESDEVERFDERDVEQCVYVEESVEQ